MQAAITASEIAPDPPSCGICGTVGPHVTVYDCLVALRELAHAERLLRVIAEQDRDQAVQRWEAAKGTYVHRDAA
jgi:hypothetical protein